MDAQLPLCVDCDGTLIRSDLLHESVLLLAKRSPFSILKLPFWLMRGKAYTKRQIADRVDVDVSALPYNEPVLELIRKAKRAGSRIVLATASPRKQAEAVASHLSLFDEVVATDDDTNMSGRHKAAQLEQRYGKRGFLYAGNSRDDIPVWERSGGAIFVGRSATLKRAASRLAPLVGVVATPRPSFRQYSKAIRIHQWLKNLLVFVPVLASHQVGNGNALLASLLAFCAFSLCASAVYVMNDLLDLSADRSHHSKRHRPFASGSISVAQGFILVPVLLALTLLFCTRLPLLFGVVLLSYFLATCLYSLWLKNQVVVDIILLASLYTLRILAGAAATGIVPSFWLLAFSMFLFLSLAIVKRYSEMLVVAQRSATKTAGRGYLVSDMPVLMSLGTAAGYSAILILALYVNSSEMTSRYATQWPLWLILAVLLYWISRVWMKAHRNEMHEDPVVFAATDKQSWAMAAIVAVALYLAS